MTVLPNGYVIEHVETPYGYLVDVHYNGSAYRPCVGRYDFAEGTARMNVEELALVRHSLVRMPPPDPRTVRAADRRQAKLDAAMAAWRERRRGLLVGRTVWR